ncbi:MAG TPA: penicillin acylase family protein [Capillimicrobium sp.]
MRFSGGGRALGLVLAAAAAMPASGIAAPTPQPYGHNDAGGFRDVLPPGTNGRTNLAELAAFLTAGTRPKHNDDQLAMYAGLIDATPGLTAAQLGRYFKDATFGVRSGDVEREYSPRDDVTIVRDKGYGVPHVYGETRDGAMFGLGYAAAEDRLFFIDVLRHLGRAELTTFAGGAPGNRAMDEEQWAIAPYTEADLQRQADQLDDLYRAEGAQVQRDAEHYVAGINAYIEKAKLDPRLMPGEYAAVNRPLGPRRWKVTDLIATASLVGGIFGKGGGRDLTQVQLLQAFRARFGDDAGTRLWHEWAAYEDPDAPTLVRGKRFPYQTPPEGSLTGDFAAPDPGSLEPAEIADEGGAALPLPIDPVALVNGLLGDLGAVPPVGQLLGTADQALQGVGQAVTDTGAVDLVNGTLGGLGGLLSPGLSPSMSNALVVSGKRSRSGRPLAVFGPQVSYFQPQILMEQEVHAPGLDAAGAAFPGVNLYVQLGRGRDYSWSATSAGQDIIDVHTVPLCGGSRDRYEYRGQCLAMETLSKTNRWNPSAADQTPAGSMTLTAQRTKLGLVIARAKVGGRPVAFVQNRSTYMHEIDSAIGFAAFNDPDQMESASEFQTAASKIGYTFNWLYVDDRDMAYFNSGANPVRPAGVTGQLPYPIGQEWRGTEFVAGHPRLVNGQDYITSWNNKQAPGFAGADSNVFSSVFRSDMLDQEIEARLAGGKKMTLPQLVDAMGEAATTDLRGEKVLPLALEVLGTPSDPQLADAVAKLRAWVADGAHREDTDGDGVYEHSDAIRIMDAWWPRWMRVQFEPQLGTDLLAQLITAHEVDNTPNNYGDHLGSAYQNGWYGYAYKDLATLLGRPVKQAYTKRYCGNGDLDACRRVLEGSLASALAVPNDEVYAGDAACEKAGEPHDQDCYDRIVFRPLGGANQPMIDWQNRPSYQQVVEVQGHRPR